MTDRVQAPTPRPFDPVPSAPRATLGWALLLAVALHALLVVAVRPERKRPDPEPRALEVVILRQAAPTDVLPEQAEAYAQVNREGGGPENTRTATDRRRLRMSPEPLEVPPDPLVMPPNPRITVLPLSVPPALPETEPEPVVVTAVVPDPAVPSPPVPLARASESRQSPPAPVTVAQILASRNREITRLQARIEENTSSYASRTRRKAISASTREYKYASYLEAWRRKVERVGNLNYPEAAKKHQLYGSLILHVALRADGQIENLRILRSSGSEVLDQAARRIVELAAPYAPFPPDIQAETDILDITRTWQFLRSHRLGWEH